MSNTNRSSDLLNVSGKKKALVDDLANANHNKNIHDISAMFLDSDKKTFPVGQSDILSRVQAFLPQLKTANEQLENADPSKLDIENVDDEDGQYIEMNLGLGVYEEKKPGQSDSETDDEDNDDEKLIIPNSTIFDKSKKPSIEVIEKK